MADLVKYMQSVAPKYRGQAGFYIDYLAVVRQHGERESKLRLIREIQEDGLKAATERRMKEAAEFLDLQKDALLLAAPEDLDSFMQYIEWNREPRKRFYFPRRKQLLPIV